MNTSIGPLHPDVAAAERYLDRVPRSGSTATEVGPFTLFVSRGPWPYYARPRSGADPAITPADVARLRTACATAGVPLSVEWIHEVVPSFARIAVEAGLAVAFRPLMILHPAEFVGRPSGAIRILAPDHGLFVTARAVADLGFRTPGTGIGRAGEAERDALADSFAADVLQHMHDRATAGLTVTAAAFDPSGSDQSIVAVGMHQPLDDTTEIVGVATLPNARRRGWAAGITSSLVEHAFATGIPQVLLSADSEEVARIYRRLGFRQIALSCEAQPPAS